MDINLLDLFLLIDTIVFCKMVTDLKLFFDHTCLCCKILLHAKHSYHLSTKSKDIKRNWNYNSVYSVPKLCLNGSSDTLRLGRHFLQIQVHLFSLDLYFSMGPHLSFHEKMLFEWARLLSFRTAPDTLGVSTVKLARAGFFYTGDGHNCRCTFCEFIYESWQQGDEPNIIHRRFRPHCPFVVSGFNAVNVPINDLERITSPAFSTGTVVDRSPVAHNGYVSIVQPSRTADGGTDTRIASFAQKLLRQLENCQNQRLSSNTCDQNAEVEQSSITDANLQLNQLSSINLTQSQQTVSVAELEQSPQNLQAKNPDYVSLWKRRASFKNWPHDQSFASPSDLAESGFYYTGYADAVRCFQCDIGLNKWESQDNPWIEHAKWSCECPHVLNTKGPEFISAVQLEENRKQILTEQQIDDTHHVMYRRFERKRTPTDTITSATAAKKSKQQNSEASGNIPSRQAARNQVTSETQVTWDTTTETIYPRCAQEGMEIGFGSTGICFPFYGSIGSTSSSDLTTQSDLSPQKETGFAYRSSWNMRTDIRIEKYPEYIPLERRRGSFTNFPKNIDFLDPLELAECGFFYSNNADYVRCFDCGIGLRNWEYGDSPWVEHVRWSKKCPYMLQKYGQEFVDTVLLEILQDGELEREKETANISGDEEKERNLESLYTASSHETVKTDDMNKGEESSRSTDEKIQSEKQELEDHYKCKICLEDKVCIVFFPCAHLVSCKNCAHGIRLCPICRTVVCKAVRTSIL